LEKIECWAAANEEGVIAWVSPPDPVYYPNDSKIIVSEIEQQNGKKVLFNRAIILDIDQSKCFKFARDLANYSTNRPLLSSTDQIRSNPIILNTQGIHWSYILEELIPDLSLESVRVGRDRQIKAEVLLEAEKIYQELFVKTGRVNIGAMMWEAGRMGMIGSYSSSCPVVFNGQASLMEVWGPRMVVTGEKWDYHIGDCRKCHSKNIEVGPCKICKGCEAEYDRKEALQQQFNLPLFPVLNLFLN